MSNLVRLFPHERKPAADMAARLRIGVPHDETEPLVITIPEETAANIRRAALWSRKNPTEFLLDWINSGFLPSERPA